MAGSKAGTIAVISGPSGSGKSTICRALAHDPRVFFSVSATTRAPRPGEREGRDYRFLSPADFEALRAAGELLEWAAYNGHEYGTPKSQVLEAVRRGRVALLEIEVQGAAKLRAAGVEGLYLFLEPPSLEVLEQRLRARGTESEAEVARRLAIARAEWEQARRAGIYDHFVLNRELERAIAEVRRILGLEPPAGGEA